MGLSFVWEDTSVFLESVLQQCGLDATSIARMRSRKIHRGTLSEVYHLTGAEVDCILKVYREDFIRRLALESEPRFRTTFRCFPIAPFYGSTAERVDRLRFGLGVRVPRVLCEGRVPRGPYFTFMDRVLGDRLGDPQSTKPRLASLSLEMGALLARLHGRTSRPLPPAERTLWVRQVDEILHCIVDSLPPATLGGARADRIELHRRLARIVERIPDKDLGPWVLAHGDYHPSNLLFGETGQITSLIDFQLCSPGPAVVDFRWLDHLDAAAFLDAYGWPRDRRSDALWMGRLIQSLWIGLEMVLVSRVKGDALSRDDWCTVAETFFGLLTMLENDTPQCPPLHAEAH